MEHTDFKSWSERWIRLRSLSPGHQGVALQARNAAGDVAFLKILQHPARGRRMRMFREVQALQALEVPGVPRLIESNASHYAEKGYELYLAAEFIDGVQLTEIVSKDRLTPQQAVAITRDLCGILKRVHALGITHRDIKPDNVIFSSVASTVYLVDFGMAYVEDPIDHFATERASELGNRWFRLPEYSAGYTADVKRDQRSDLTFCVGLLFYMLTKIHPSNLYDESGAHPHQRPNAELMLHASGLNYEPLMRLFDTGFQGDIARRFQSVDDLLAALAAVESVPAQVSLDSVAALERVRRSLAGATRLSELERKTERLSLVHEIGGQFGQLAAQLAGVDFSRTNEESTAEVASGQYALIDATNHRHAFWVTVSARTNGIQHLLQLEAEDCEPITLRMPVGEQLGRDDVERVRNFVTHGFAEIVSEERYFRPRPLEESPWEVKDVLGPLPDRYPQLQVAWFLPRFVGQQPHLRWDLKNIGKADALDLGVFMVGIRNYAIDRIAAGQTITEDHLFDQRSAYHEIYKPTCYAIVDFADPDGRLYRQTAVAAPFPASARLGTDADYITTQFSRPYLVDRRTVIPDPPGDDRFYRTTPIDWSLGTT